MEGGRERGMEGWRKRDGKRGRERGREREGVRERGREGGGDEGRKREARQVHTCHVLHTDHCPTTKRSVFSICSTC